MTRDSSAEDIRLWKKLQNGDKRAISALFEKYYTPLLNYGLKLIPEEALIKDSIQELFYVLWEQRENLSEVEYMSILLCMCPSEEQCSGRQKLKKQDMREIRPTRMNFSGV
ncbi:MAG: hypothetical protein U5K69_06785 [Balneolaceae bacterium]|nr:hypothetical protein [Balneolaceae bacterium]